MIKITIMPILFFLIIVTTTSSIFAEEYDLSDHPYTIGPMMKMQTQVMNDTLNLQYLINIRWNIY